MMLFYCSVATNSDLSAHIFDVNKMDMNVNDNHSIVPRSDYSADLIAGQ